MSCKPFSPPFVISPSPSPTPASFKRKRKQIERERERERGNRERSAEEKNCVSLTTNKKYLLAVPVRLMWE